jgi:hypothetical protein
MSIEKEKMDGKRSTTPSKNIRDGRRSTSPGKRSRRSISPSKSISKSSRKSIYSTSPPTHMIKPSRTRTVSENSISVSPNVYRTKKDVYERGKIIVAYYESRDSDNNKQLYYITDMDTVNILLAIAGNCIKMVDE